MNTSIFVLVGLIRNHGGDYLLIQRDEPEQPAAHLKWELPGGKVDFGETAEAALAREIYEETGYSVEVGSLLPRPQMSMWQYGVTTQHTIIFCFNCRLIHEQKANVTDHHVSNMKWVSKNDISNYDLLPGVEVFLQNLE
jgi:mutator protein MutT